MKKLTVWMVVGAMVCLASAVHAQGLAGTWQGSLLAAPNPDIRTEIKITEAVNGVSTGTMYRVDQADWHPTPVTLIKVQGRTVTFAVVPMDATYEGKLSADGTLITGTWAHGPTTHPLNLLRATDATAWAIPPTPEPPKSMPTDAKPKFDVVTVKPTDPDFRGKLFTVRGRHMMTLGTNLNDLVSFAYGLHVKQIVGAPDWFGTDKFDIDGVPDVEGSPSAQQMKLLVQDALTQRFGLKFHHDQRELAVYVLTVAKGGPKMTVTADPPNGERNFLYRMLGDLRVSNMSMEGFCDGMQGSAMDKPVVDHTGLTDRYDFNLKWTPDDSQFAQFGPRPPQPPNDDPNAPPSLYTALQEQLGLKLEPAKTKVDVIAIDQVEKPTEN